MKKSKTRMCPECGKGVITSLINACPSCKVPIVWVESKEAYEKLTTNEAKFAELRKPIATAQITMAGTEHAKTYCALDHSGDPRVVPDLTAVNTLMLKHEENYFPFHVCDVCQESLNDPNSEWFLFICFGCGSTKWVHKNFIRRNYKEQIVGMNDCPNCGEDQFKAWDA